MGEVAADFLNKSGANLRTVAGIHAHHEATYTLDRPIPIELPLASPWSELLVSLLLASDVTKVGSTEVISPR